MSKKNGIKKQEVVDSCEFIKNYMKNPKLWKQTRLNSFLDQNLKILCNSKVMLSIKFLGKLIKKCMFCNEDCKQQEDCCDLLCKCNESVHKTCLSNTALQMSPEMDAKNINIQCLKCTTIIPNSLIESCFQQQILTKIKTTSTCPFCNQIIYSLDGSIKFKNCDCDQRFHVKCLKEATINASPWLEEPELLEKLLCNYCAKPINFNTIKECFTVREITERQNEGLNQKFIEELKRQDEFEREEETRNKTALCEICSENKKIATDFITFDCDHRFCKECVESLALTSIESMKCSSDDLTCPTCAKPISIFILKNVLKEEDFKKYDNFVVHHYQSKIFTNEEIAIRCPNSECYYFFVINKNNNIKRHTCEVCKTYFCINGCKEPHDGKTCDEYRRETMEQEAEEQFNLLVQREKLRKCPKCDIWVHKYEGCNHITCKRCAAQFCYTCGTFEWKKCGHQMQY